MSYISQTELETFYSRTTSYSSDQISGAISRSYGLVNSYLNASLKLPYVMPWDGFSSYVESPQILKYVQLRLAQHDLEEQNVGWTEEGQKFFDSTIAIIQGITQNELSLPGQYTDRLVGWNIANISCSGLAGGFYLDPNSPPPAYETTLTFTIDSAGTNYIASGVTFDTYQTDRAEPYINGTTATSLYQTVTDSLGNIVSFRWTGQWTFADSVTIVGIPVSAINKFPESKDLLKQRPLAY